MDVIFIPLLRVGQKILGIYQFLVLVYVIMGWLESFNIIDRYNQIVYNLHTFLFRIVEPALIPMRRLIPHKGGIDFSPLVLLLIIYFIQGVVGQILVKFPS